MEQIYKKSRALQHYIGTADLSYEEALVSAKTLGDNPVVGLSQRGSHRGWLSSSNASQIISQEEICKTWARSEPIVLSGFISPALLQAHKAHIDQSYELMNRILNDEECNDIFQQEPYVSRIPSHFEILSSIYDENDPQAIEKIECDVIEGEEVIAENLWIKLSWLSFIENDASIRFRFSFGIESYEDVAADPQRQHYAAELTDAIFPESALVSQNESLKALLCQVFESEDISYVERIVFFNAPEGGAQFHQDIEKGHQGVIFAQISGRTGWLTLSKEGLIGEIKTFLKRSDASILMAEINSSEEIKLLYSKVSDNILLSAYLDDPDNDPLEKLINRVPAFAQQLVEHGHVYVVNPGDIVLLPQQGIDHCAWHAVLCLDDFPGEALSFAVRERNCSGNDGQRI